MQTNEAQERAAHELRLLGLPVDLVDDLIALAARRLGEPRVVGAVAGQAVDGDTPPDAAVRALVIAARGILGQRRDGCFQPLPDLAGATPLPAPTAGPTLTVDLLTGPADHVDLLRRAVTELAVHEPDLLAGALAAITLAGEAAENDPTVAAEEVVRRAAERGRPAVLTGLGLPPGPDPAAIEALLLLAVDCRFARTSAPAVPPTPAAPPTPGLTHRARPAPRADRAHG